MALTLHLPAHAAVKPARPVVSDMTVALAFAIVPLVLFALAVAVFGFNPMLDFAAASVG